MTTSLWALQPIANDYDDPINTFNEIRNITDNAQDKSFTMVTSSPTLLDLRDGEMVVYSSGIYTSAGNVHLVLRVGTTLYYSPNFRLMTGR